MSLQEVEDKRKLKVKKQEDEVTEEKTKKQKEEAETKRMKDSEKLLEVQNYLRVLVEKIPDDNKVPQSCGAEVVNLVRNKQTFNDRVCFLQSVTKEASEEYEERKIRNNMLGPITDSEDESEGSRSEDESEMADGEDSPESTNRSEDESHKEASSSEED